MTLAPPSTIRERMPNDRRVERRDGIEIPPITVSVSVRKVMIIFAYFVSNRHLRLLHQQILAQSSSRSMHETHRRPAGETQ